VFRADPSLGFPPGTPPGRSDVSWHGLLHVASASIGFACLIIACFVMARRFRAERRFGWARYSQLTGVLFTGGFQWHVVSIAGPRPPPRGSGASRKSVALVREARTH